MNLLKLSASYLRQRPFSTLLNVLILALGIATIVVLLLVSDRVEQNLTRNAEGIDLVVGAKGSPLQLILSSVYHIDAPTGNIPVAEAEALMENRAVAEAMPLALGDSYRGFRIVGATQAYAEHYGGEVARGRFWSGTMEATLGAVAAREVGLDVGDVFYSAHGLGAGGEAHDEHPIEVVGVLAETGTVLDRLLLTSIETVWDVHGAHGDEHHGDEHHGDITVTSITATSITATSITTSMTMDMKKTMRMLPIMKKTMRIMHTLRQKKTPQEKIRRTRETERRNRRSRRADRRASRDRPLRRLRGNTRRSLFAMPPRLPRRPSPATSTRKRTCKRLLRRLRRLGSLTSSASGSTPFAPSGSFSSWSPY